MSEKYHGRDTVTQNVRWLWLTGGGVLVAGMWLCVWGRVNHNVSAGFLNLTAVGIGAVYLLLLMFWPKRTSKAVWAAMIVVAILMRMPWFFVPASSGEDYCRYLWDGAVTANSINPYVHSPRQISQGQVDNPTLKRLAQSSCSTLEGINHPKLRTIYPPVAQGAFALAYWIAPFELTGWRVVLLAFDVLAAMAVLGLIRAARLPVSLIFIYLWNPLLVTESYGGCHVDLLAGALVAAFAWALATKRPITATVALALAVGVKLWPVLLLPFLLRSLWGNWRRITVSAATLAVLLGAMAIPFVAAFGTQADSGLLNYAQIWASRSGAYQAFDRFGWWLREELSLGWDGYYIGRILMMLVLLPAVLWLGLRWPSDTSVLCGRMSLVILLMLLLSPVLWPWYYVAVIPLAVVARLRLGLLLWTALLPLCYLEAGQLTWLIHVPVWLVLMAEWAWRLRRETKNA